MIKIQYTGEKLLHFKVYSLVVEIFYLFIVSEDAKKDADSVRKRMLRHVTLLQS